MLDKKRARNEKRTANEGEGNKNGFPYVPTMSDNKTGQEHKKEAGGLTRRMLSYSLRSESMRSAICNSKNHQRLGNSS